MKLTKKDLYGQYFKATFFINMAAIIIGILRFTTIVFYEFIMDYLMLYAFLNNFILIYITFHYVNANSKEGHKIYAHCWLYLLVFLIAIFIMATNIYILSRTLLGQGFFPWFLYIITPTAIFSTFLFAGYISWINFTTINERGYWKFEQKEDS